MDTVTRQRIEDKPTDTNPITASEQAKPEIDVDPPYLDYEKVNSKPYVADYFNLGSTWDDPYGGFPKEVSTIEGYIKSKIQSGEIANSKTAVKEEIKKMERMTNVSKEERSLIKVETLAAYIQFLNKTNDIKYNLRRYGTEH